MNGPSVHVVAPFTGGSSGQTLPAFDATNWAGYLTDVITNHLKIAASLSGVTSSVTGFAGDYYKTSFGADQEVGIKIKTLPGANFTISMDLRVANPSLGTTVTRYAVACDYASGTGNWTYTLYKQVAGGTVTSIGSDSSGGTHNAVNNDIIFLRAVGTSIKLFRWKSADDTLIECLSVTDSTISAGGFTAIYVSGSGATSVELTDYRAGDVAVVSRAASISATSSVTGGIIRLHPLGSVAAISATSSVTGGLVGRLTRGDQFDHTKGTEIFRGGSGLRVTDQFDHLRVGELATRLNVTPSPSQPVVPAAIGATSSVSATINKRVPLAGISVSATSTVSGTVSRASTKLLTGSVSATSTVAATVAAKKLLHPASISATSTVSAVVGARRFLIAASISATSTVSITLLKIARRIQASSINALSIVSAAVARAHALSGAISASATVSGDISKRGGIGDKFDHTRRGELFRAGGTAVDQFNFTRVGEFPRAINIYVLSTAKNVVPADAIIAYAIVTGGLYRPQKSIGSGAISATSSITASLGLPAHAGDQFDHSRRGELFPGGGTSDQFNHTRRGELARSLNVVASSPSSPLKPLGVGVISATSSVTGAVRKTGKLTPAAISATSTVAGALLRHTTISGAAIAATSQVIATTGGGYGSGGYGQGNYGGPSPGGISVRRAIKPAVIFATSSMSAPGFGFTKHISPNAILAVSIVSVTVGARRPIAGVILAASSVSGGLIGKKTIRGSILATSTFTTSLSFGSGKISTGAILAQSFVSAFITLRRTPFGGIVLAKSTVTGRVVLAHQVQGVISATAIMFVHIAVASQRPAGTKHRIFSTDSTGGQLLSTGER